MRKVFVLLLLLLNVTFLKAQTIQISMDTVTSSPGDSITIPVYASNFNNIGSFTFFVQFNAAVLNWGRIFNWNPLLTQGVHLGNASGSQVAVVWADPNGISINDGKLFDLRFKYKEGSCFLEFTNQCEITDMIGNPLTVTVNYSNGYVTRRLSVAVTATPQALCYGDSTQLSFTTLGGLGNNSFQWSSDPPGFNSLQENPFITPENNTYYQIMVSDGHDTINASILVTVYFFVTPNSVENMTPADGAGNLSLPVLFSWSPAANASQYDLYLWKEGEPEPTSPLVSNITQITYLLNTFLQYGNAYYWKVVAKNPCLQAAGVVQTFSTRHLPDLIVNEINTPSQVYSGQTINVEFMVKNIGQGGTLSTQWYDMVYLSTDTTIDFDVDHYVGAYPNLTYLNPQQAYNQLISFTLPQGISGYYYILVWTDKNNNLLETNDNNNQNFNRDTMLVYLSPVPDLQVAKIIVQNNAFSGQQLSITWNVKNNGLANTGYLQWNDRVYISADTVFNATAVSLGTFKHIGDLPVDSLYQQVRTIAIPNYIYGRYYFYITTDIYNQVYEHALENNNTFRSDSITIFLTPPPDLVTTAVIAPNAASNYEPLTIHYTVQNEGATPAIGPWWDKVYITNSLTLNTSTALLLGSYKRSITLLPDSSYTHQINVTIPSQITGPHYIFVFTDANLNVFEHTQEENNIKRCSHSTEILSPDLFVPDIFPLGQLNSGQQVTVSYYSKNQGNGKLIGSWADKIYLSALPVFYTDSSTLLGTNIINYTQILINDSLLQQKTVTIPNGIAGNYFVYVVSDCNNTIFEPLNENNNISRTELEFPVVLTPWPDLVVTQLTLSEDTVTPGFPFHVTYTVKNEGPGPLTGQHYQEYFYVNSTPSALIHYFFQYSIQDTIDLLPDSSFSRTIPITLPSWVTVGDHYFWIRTDGSDQVYEHTGENNNILRSEAFYSREYPPVDLVATSLSTAESCFSGNNITVLWSGRNDGTVPSLTEYWYDRVYLSSDTTPNPSTDLYLNQYIPGLRLYPGNSYSMQEQVFIPNGISGEYYLYVVIDFLNTNRDPNMLNNIRMHRQVNGTPIPLQITLTPPPDLTITSFNCPATGTTGQPLNISYTIKNQGIGQTPAALWYDYIYLSTDFIVDPGDFILSVNNHYGLLAVDSSYSNNSQFYIPNWATGNYIILLKTDALDNLYELDHENNNVANQLINIQQAPPSDLVITQIIPPDEAITGENISITYTLKNIGVNPAVGYMKDLVYFSEDTIWDITDVFFGSVNEYTSLGPDAVANRTVNGILSGIMPGDWHVIVRTDVLNNINEANDNNNSGWSVEKIRISIPELPINSWVSNTLTDYNPIYYRLEIPSTLVGETMQVKLLGDSIGGSNEIYMSYSAFPSRTSFEYSYNNPNYGNQDILIPYLQEGTYYLMIYGSTIYGNNQAVQLIARILNFQILSIHTNQGGNTGKVTVKLSGSKFAANMGVFLIQGEQKIPGTDYLFIDASKAYVTFDLSGAETGMYDVMATKLCEGYTTLVQGFTIVEGSTPDLQVNYYYPSGARPQGIISIQIEYTNAGNCDLLAPEIELISLAGAPVSLTVTGLSQGEASLYLQLNETGGPPGILRPGMSGTIIVYAKATKGMGFYLKLPNY